MNSKEALRNIVRLSGMGGFLKNEEEIIKQDLEMLEIIKKHLIISGLSITCFISGNPSCKEDYEKRFEQIKRWLKSE